MQHYDRQNKRFKYRFVTKKLAALGVLYHENRHNTIETHRYFIEPISNVPHIKTVLCTRFVQFVTSLSNCHKLCIRLLVELSKHDLRTVLC